MGMLVAAIVMNLMMQGAMMWMILFINSLQMIVHLPMMQVILPANVAEFYGFLIPIAMFDVVEVFFAEDIPLEFDHDGQESLNNKLLDQMQDLGYDSHNSVLNLGTIAVFSFIYYVRVLFYFLGVKPFVYFTNRGKAYMKSFGESLFFGELLFLAMEAYLEFLISGYLNLSEPLSTTSGETVAVALGAYAIILTLVVVPILFVYTVFR